MNVQNVSTVPSHIDNFLKGNNEKLNEIYDEGYICDDFRLKEIDYYTICDTNKYAKLLHKYYKKKECI